jgi:hypothetical protein
MWYILDCDIVDLEGYYSVLLRPFLLTCFSDEKFITLNLDQYFTGYRSTIDIEFPLGKKYKSLASPLDDPNFIQYKDVLTFVGKFEFSSIPEDDLKQKGMIYLGENLYVYVDCKYITYIKIDN